MKITIKNRAIHYNVHDDGKKIDDINSECDLTGVSRTSKTPTSLSG